MNPYMKNPDSVVTRRAGHVLVSYDKDLYMWGGYMEKEHEKTYNLMTQSDTRFHNPWEIWIYSSLLNKWSRKICTGEIPISLYGSCAGVIDHYMYIFGGCNGEESSNVLWRLDLHSFVWKILNPSGFSPFACEMSASWVYLDRFYIFGGYGPNINRDGIAAPVRVAFEPESGTIFKGWLDQFFLYDSSNNCWTWPVTKGPKPFPRSALSATVLKNRAFMFGGRYKDKRLNDFISIQLESHTWSFVELTPASSVPVGRSWHTLNAVSVDKLLLYGGFSSLSQVLNDCWLAQIIPVSDEKVEGFWKEIELAYDHGEPRCNHCAATIAYGQIVIVSGLTQPYYLMMNLLVEHAEEMLKIRLSPPSLFELTLEYVCSNENNSRNSWSQLAHHIRKILEIRSNSFTVYSKI